MTLVIALTIAVIIQFIAAFIAISLFRYTKFNFSWILISVAFLLMAIRRMIELLHAFRGEAIDVKNDLLSWIAVAISFFILIGLIYIKRIFILQNKLNELRKENESRVLSAVINTAESERSKFARELHDGLGPLISAIKMAVSAIVPDKKHSKNQEILENTNKLIDESISAIKEISNKLSPHILINFGLLKALQSFKGKLEFSESLSISINSNIKDLRFDYNIEVVLYRIICELITNTINHADATELKVDLNFDQQLLSLEYFDNGIGFDAEKVLQGNKGMGYTNIQSHIKSLNGTIKVSSQPNQGTHVKITLQTEANE